jgi:hypothetical protein
LIVKGSGADCPQAREFGIWNEEHQFEATEGRPLIAEKAGETEKLIPQELKLNEFRYLVARINPCPFKKSGCLGERPP